MRENIKNFVSFISDKISLKGNVIEFGSFQVDGQVGYADLRPYFKDCNYIGADIRVGVGVDVICDIHRVPFKKKTCKWVLCLETLEHVFSPLDAVKEMSSLVDNDGVFIISSVMDFPIHEHPADYWRFTPQLFYKVLDQFKYRAVLFQGNILKPHTIIGIASNSIDFDKFSFPENLQNEYLHKFNENNFEEQEYIEDGSQKYFYKINMKNENSVYYKILKEIKPHSDVLEIGCASGHVSQYLKNNLKCKVYGIEIDEVAGTIAKPFLEKLIIGDVQDSQVLAKLGEQKFDYILLMDVLEHLQESESTLKKLLPYLKPNGILLISVPNVAHGSIIANIIDGKWDYNETGLLDSTHVKFFTRKTIFLELERAGFFVTKIDRVIMEPWNTEFKTDWFKIPEDIRKRIENSNPDIFTYQFVIKAVPMEKSSAVKLLEERADTLLNELDNFRKLFANKKEEIETLKNRIALLEKEKWEVEQEKTELEVKLNEFELENNNLINKEKQLNEKIIELEAKQQELKNRIYEQNNQLLSLKFQIAEIENSLAWSIITKYRKIIDVIFPEQSKLRKIYLLFLNAIKYLKKEGFYLFLKKSYNYFQKLKGSSNLQEECIDFTKDIKPLSFKVFEKPFVSIIIPVYNQATYTYNCLKSILENSGNVEYEVIIIDDCSSDNTEKIMQSINGINYVKNKENLGFLKNCNKGAKIAKGKYLLFLNNDTMVTKKWLENMLKLFENIEKCGMVGAKLVYPDGKLQEAGSIIFSDGSAWNFGKFDEPELPEYNYVREVDYCSGAAILIKKELFESIGMFSEEFAPAYYEDTDLSMKVRAAGYKVMYQPFSKIIHFEGVSCGKDTSCGIKKFQEINREKFYNKWKNILEKEHYPDSSYLYLSKERGVKKRVLIIDHYLPEYDKDSGSLRLYSLIKIMIKNSMHVIFWPDNLAAFEPYNTHLRELGVETFTGRHFNFEKEFLKIKDYLDYIWLLRPHIAKNYIQTINNLKSSKTKVIYDTVDLHFVREKRRAEIENNEKFLEESRKWKDIEMFLCNSSDHVIAITEIEKKTLNKEGIDNNKIYVIPNVHEPVDKIPEFELREGLMFIGGFQHPPNGDAVKWFVKEIYPIICEKFQKIPVYIVGSNATADIKQLADDYIKIEGFIPDVAPYFNKSKVFISPLRYGAGLKGKIGQSLAFGLPVVTTSIGAEGFYYNENEPPFLIADDKETFAEMVIKLYKDRETWEKLSERGLFLIKNFYSPAAIEKGLLKLLI